MTWDELRNNWRDTISDLKIRFPRLDNTLVATPPDSFAEFADHVAIQHDLTVAEATEDVTDWMHVVSLARIASEASHDISDQ